MNFCYVMKVSVMRVVSAHLTDPDLVEFAFYVNKSGWRARPNWIVHWEGSPTAFGE